MVYEVSRLQGYKVCGKTPLLNLHLSSKKGLICYAANQAF